MQRRRFLRSIAAAPASATLVAELAQGQQKPAGNDAPALPTVSPNFIGDTVHRFFTPPQFAALQRLGELLVPAQPGVPGAIEAAAPEFLDFLIGASPAPRKRLYRNGLDGLNAAARKQFNKDFHSLDATQADRIIRPLLVAWTYEPPADPMIHFFCEVHDDLRKATTNSPAYAEAASKSAARRRGLSSGLYLRPLA
jgi:hypothetical protein